MMKSFLLSALIILSLFSLPTFAQVQSHPLSQLYPMDANLDVIIITGLITLFGLYLIGFVSHNQKVIFPINFILIVLVVYEILAYSPPILFKLNSIVIGLVAGFLVYLLSKFTFQFKKQLISIWGILVESVLLAPIVEEIIFRFGIITVIFNNSLLGLAVSIVLWTLAHYIGESLVRPTGYYKSTIGILTAIFSGIVFGSIYLITGNLLTSILAHAFYNFLIVLSAQANTLVSLRLVPMVDPRVLISSYRIFGFPLIKVLLPAIIAFILFSSIALAQVQSHPLSQLYPMDVNLNLTGVNTTNVSYIFFGNNSVDTYLFRSASSVLTLNSHLIASGGWVNSTSVNLTNLYFSDDVQLSRGAANRLTLASGDSFAITDLTTGSVIFAGASGVLSQDNTNLFWDDTNNRLGIGTASPSSLLHISGSNSNAMLNISNGTNSVLFVNGTLERVGIGTTTPQNALNIIGDINATGTIYGSSLAAGRNITGFGIVGYIPQWSNGTALNNSNIFQLGSNVGIGITSPQSLLHVSGTDNFLNVSNGTRSFLLTNTTHTVLQPGSSSAVYSFRSGAVEFTTGNSEDPDVRISSGSTAHLWLSGAGSIQSTGGDLSLIAQGSSEITLNTDSDSDVNIGSGQLFVQGTTGNVGINTTAPSSLLNVMTHSTDTKVAANISNYGSGNSFVVEDSAADTTPFLIDSAGSVGIGTLTPQNTLNVVGDINATGTIYGSSLAAGRNITGFGIAGYIPQWVNGTALNNSNIFQLGSNVGIGTASPVSLLHINGSNNNAMLNISNGTNSVLFVNGTLQRVGIGTTSPGSALTVAGTIQASGTNNLFLSDALIQQQYGGPLIIETQREELRLTAGSVTTSYPITFYTSNTERMRITNTGLVGINTTSPQALLQVATVSSSSTDAVNITNLGTGDSFVVEDSAGDTTPFAVDNAGNVEIGNRLRFNTFTNGLTDFAYASGNDAIIQSANGALRFAPAGTELLRLDGPTGNVSIGFGVDSSPDAVLEVGNTSAIRGSWFMVSDSADGDGNIFIIDINKRVGIGTTSPLYALQINNVSMGLNVSNLLFVNNTAVGIGTSILGAYKLNVIGDINASWVNATNINVSNSLYGPNFVAASGWGNFSRLNVSDTAYIPTLGMNINVNSFNVSSVNRLGIGAAASQNDHLLVDGHGSPFTITGNTTQTSGIATLHSMTKTTAGNQTANQFSGQFDIKLLEGNTANWTGNFQVLGTSMDLRGDNIGKYWVENAYHLRMDGGSLTATDPNVTNLYGLYVSNMGTANTTNAYGIYTENFANSGATNKYAIYSAGGNNYLGGNVGIGTASPVQKLDVVGVGNFTQGINATGDVYLDSNLNFVGTQNISTSSGNLFLKPGGEVVLDSGNDLQMVFSGGTRTVLSTTVNNLQIGNGITGIVDIYGESVSTVLVRNADVRVIGSMGIASTETAPGNYRLNVIGDINASWMNATNINVSNSLYGPNFVAASGWGNFSRLNVSDTAYINRLVTPYNNTLVVAKEGGDYTTITAALDNISDSGKFNRYLIKVMPGFYNESVSLCNTDNYVHIQGSGRETTVISSGNSPVVDFCNNAWAMLSDLWVEKTSSGGAVISLSGDNVLNNVKVNNAVVNNGGSLISTAGGIPNLIVMNSIIGNYENATAINMGGDPSTSSIVSNNIIRVSGAGSIGIRSSNLGYTINSSYNVIIGAEIPFQTASSATIYSRFDHFDNNPVGTNITISDYSRNTNITAFLVNQSGTGDIAQFYDASSPALIIKDGGNVGIGTTTPGNYKLNVIGDINASWVNVTNLNVSNTFSAANFKADTWLNGTSLNISGANNVSIDSPTLFVDVTNNRIGIGATAPTQTLNVVGDFNVTGTSYIPTLGANINVNGYNVSSVNRLGIGAAASRNDHLIIDGHGSPFTVTSNTTQTSGIATLHSMTKTTAGNQTANQWSGSFDIKLLEGNTANWTGNFMVLGTSMDLRGDSIGKYWVENAYHLRMDGGSLAATDPNVTNLYGLYVSNMGTVNTTNAYGIYTENFANSGATNKYAIYSAGGNVYLGGSVGIGTTSPASLLHISGSNNNALLNISNGTNSVLFVNGTTESVGIGTANPASKLHVTNTTDSASSQVAIFEGDRATPAANDEAYVSFRLSDSAGTQTEFGRMSMVGGTVTDASETGLFTFDAMIGGTFREVLRFGSPGSSSNNAFTVGNAANGQEFQVLSNVGAGGSVIEYVPNTEVVINNAQANVDFRVEGDTNANVLFVDASADSVGIGTTTPANKLNIEGSGNALNVSSGASCSYIAAGATAFTACSSRDIKENIKPFKVNGILERISNTPVNTFDFKNCTESGCMNKLGLIAEDFYPVLERGDNRTVDGQDVQMTLWLGTQELIKENEKLKTENAELKSQLDNLESRIVNLEKISLK